MNDSLVGFFLVYSNDLQSLCPWRERERESVPTSTENSSKVSDEMFSLGDKELAADGKLFQIL